MTEPIQKGDILIALRGIKPTSPSANSNLSVPAFKHAKGWRLGNGPSKRDATIYLNRVKGKVGGRVYAVKIVATEPSLVAMILPKSAVWSLVPQWKRIVNRKRIPNPNFTKVRSDKRRGTQRKLRSYG